MQRMWNISHTFNRFGRFPDQGNKSFIQRWTHKEMNHRNDERSKENSGSELHRRARIVNYRSKCISDRNGIKERRMWWANRLVIRMSSLIFLSTLFISSLGVTSASPLLDLSLNFPPFEKASADAKTEFSNIISVRLSFFSREIIEWFQNESLTKGQLETEIKSWAAKNNATVSFLIIFSQIIHNILRTQ